MPPPRLPSCTHHSDLLLHPRSEISSPTLSMEGAHPMARPHDPLPHPISLFGRSIRTIHSPRSASPPWKYLICHSQSLHSAYRAPAPTCPLPLARDAPLHARRGGRLAPSTSVASSASSSRRRLPGSRPSSPSASRRS